MYIYIVGCLGVCAYIPLRIKGVRVECRVCVYIYHWVFGRAYLCTNESQGCWGSAGYVYIYIIACLGVCAYTPMRVRGVRVECDIYISLRV